MQFALCFKIHGKTGHVVVDGEDALIAALKVKMERPNAHTLAPFAPVIVARTTTQSPCSMRPELV
jgi:hypothetical protein